MQPETHIDRIMRSINSPRQFGYENGITLTELRRDYAKGELVFGPNSINPHGNIHGGAIAGMFDTAFGVVANFTAGENEATTTDMTISFLRGVEYGMDLEMTVYIVKAGRSLIRQRAELKDAATGKLLASGSGSWMPL